VKQMRESARRSQAKSADERVQKKIVELCIFTCPFFFVLSSSFATHHPPNNTMAAILSRSAIGAKAIRSVSVTVKEECHGRMAGAWSERNRASPFLSAA